MRIFWDIFEHWIFSCKTAAIFLHDRPGCNSWYVPQSAPCGASACVNSSRFGKRPAGPRLSPAPGCYWARWRCQSSPRPRCGTGRSPQQWNAGQRYSPVLNNYQLSVCLFSTNSMSVFIAANYDINSENRYKHALLQCTQWWMWLLITPLLTSQTHTDSWRYFIFSLTGGLAGPWFGSRGCWGVIGHSQKPFHPFHPSSVRVLRIYD